MAVETWLAYCAMETVLCFTPGPAVLFVVSTALAGGSRAGIGAMCGVLVANTLYFALSWTGVAAAIATSSTVFATLKWAGAAYLTWVGLGMLFAAGDRPTAPSGAAPERALARGVVVQGSNPKALIFFLALLPQFVDPTVRVGFQLLVLGISGLVIELVVLSIYVTLAVRVRRVAGAGLARPLERLGGGVLTALGLRMALARSG